MDLERPPPADGGGAEGRLAPRLLGRLDGGEERSADDPLSLLLDESFDGLLRVALRVRGASPDGGAADGGAVRDEPRSAELLPRLGGALDENEPRPDLR